ncbi:MAG: RNA 2',3'-cyclic phosphodiesterase, partial [Acidobacteriota bacterium]|nr:RNA 2',3'-cyclic phosphodiesterase [Acidobacteriota bacterium]
MRAFVAFEVPMRLRRLIVDEARRAESQFPAARWVKLEALHLTVLFLGEIAAERAGELSVGLERLFATSRPLRLEICGAGTFPAAGPARVLWLGIESPDDLHHLADAVRFEGRDFMQRPEKRPFAPHLTVARCRQPWPRQVAERWRSDFTGAIGEG